MQCKFSVSIVVFVMLLLQPQLKVLKQSSKWQLAEHKRHFMLSL